VAQSMLSWEFQKAKAKRTKNQKRILDIMTSCRHETARSLRFVEDCIHICMSEAYKHLLHLFSHLEYFKWEFYSSMVRQPDQAQRRVSRIFPWPAVWIMLRKQNMRQFQSW
jgi:hypothetical protein